MQRSIKLKLFRPYEESMTWEELGYLLRGLSLKACRMSNFCLTHHLLRALKLETEYLNPQGHLYCYPHLAAGYAAGNMPLSQRFSMGGANLRGYRENQFLGNSMLKGTVEYRMPISKKLTGLVFMDSGYAWDKRDEKKFDLDKIKFSYGLGVRFWSPIGPVKLDYGIGNDQKRFHFSFGYPF